MMSRYEGCAPTYYSLSHFTFRLLKPGGVKAVAAENLLLKQQLLIIRRSRLKTPNLTTKDRFMLGWLAMFLSPARSCACRLCILDTRT